jgi:hypothetical protein
MLSYYILIGLIYVVINGTIRGIYNDDNSFLVLVHWFLWPIFVLMLLISRLYRLIKK